MSFQVPFNARDVLSSYASAQSSAMDRDMELSSLGKKAKKAKTPLTKLVYQHAVSQVDPAFQETQIEKLAGQGSSFERGVKQYIADRTRSFDEKTSNRLRGQALVGALSRGQYGEDPLEGYGQDIYGELGGGMALGEDFFRRSRSQSRQPREPYEVFGMSMAEEMGVEPVDIRIDPQQLQNVLAIRAFEEQEQLRNEMVQGPVVREIYGTPSSEVNVAQREEQSRQIMDLVQSAEASGLNVGPINPDEFDVGQAQEFVRLQSRLQSNPAFMAQVASQQTFFSSPLETLASGGSPSRPVSRSLFGGPMVQGSQFQWSREEEFARQRGWVQNPLFGTAPNEGYFIPPELLEQKSRAAAALGMKPSGSIADLNPVGGGVRGRPPGFKETEETKAKRAATKAQRRAEKIVGELVGSAVEQAEMRASRGLGQGVEFSLFD